MKYLLGFIISCLSFFSCAQEQPNILWVSVEDISPDLGCYGDENANTPVLDELAKEGVLYSNAIANAPVCAPARTTIITGLYQTSVGGHHMRCKGKMPENLEYYPQLLRARGYFCTNNSKEDYNLEYNSEEIWDESSRTAHWRKRKESSQPFFSIFNLTLTHESCINSKEKHERVTADLPKHLRADPQSLVLPPYFPDTEKVRELWARHYDNISMMDIRVGEILSELEEDGLSDNTIVVFFSDHGTGVPRHKRWLYDSGIKVPMIVYASKSLQHLIPSPTGIENDELVSFVDLPATVLNLAGINVPEHMQGRPFLGKNLGPPRQYVYAARDRMDERYDMQRAVRSKEFKYIRYYESYQPFTQYMNTPEQGDIMKAIRKAHLDGTLPKEGQHMMLDSKPKEELFHLKQDPNELNNLAVNPAYQNLLAEMRGAHAEWSDETKDTGLIPETIIRTWEKQHGKSIYEILREIENPINEIREAALGVDINQLTKSLIHKNEAVRYWSAISLGNATQLKEQQKTIKTLDQLLGDPIAAVRIAAARALCKSINSTDAVDTLIRELSHEDEWVRLLAAQVLDEIGEQARPAERAMQERIDLIDSNKYVVRVVNRALNELNSTNNRVK